MRMALRASAVLIAAMLVGACGAPPSADSTQSPLSAIASPSVPSSPGSVPASSPSPAPAPVAPVLVIRDIAKTQVRLARLDATDVATVTGQYDGIAGGQVIIGNGTTLEALDRSGTVKKLGQLAGTPNWFDPSGPVAVKSDLSQWLYTLTDDKWTSRIHLGTPTGDTLIATIPSPNGNSFYQAYAWNASGVYMVKEPIGLGGAGPFLEYHFNLAKFDLATHRVADVSPACGVYAVLEDGTMICRNSYASVELEVRTPSGTHNIQIALGSGTASAYEFWKVLVSPDGKRLVAGRNGAKDPVLNYQMAEADLSASSLASFGPLDYNPAAWLPDGRVVAEHQCVYIDWGAGPCSASLDGTYVFSADGKSRTLFYRLKSGWVVGSI